MPALRRLVFFNWQADVDAIKAEMADGRLIMATANLYAAAQAYFAVIDEMNPQKTGK